MFSGTRWNILKLLSEAELSPIEIAQLLDTTPANISQQLRLLELGGLVKSEKTRNVEKGKPRIVYSLSSNLSYLILASNNYAEKKQLPLSPYHSFVLRGWFLNNEEHHEAVNMLYWQIKPYLKEIEKVAATTTKKELEVIISAKNPEKLKKLTDAKSEIKLKIMSSEEFRNLSAKKAEYHLLFDQRIE